MSPCLLSHGCHHAFLVMGRSHPSRASSELLRQQVSSCSATHCGCAPASLNIRQSFAYREVEERVTIAAVWYFRSETVVCRELTGVTIVIVTVTTRASSSNSFRISVRVTFTQDWMIKGALNSTKNWFWSLVRLLVLIIDAAVTWKG